MKMLVIAVGAPISMWLMVEIFANGRVDDEQLLIAYVASFGVSVFILIVYVIPDYRRNAIFIYEVTDEYVLCSCAGGEGYRLKLSDIVRLVQIKHTMGRATHEDFIVTVDGEMHKIPMKYGLKIDSVKKAIRTTNPNVVSENVVRP